MRTVAATIFALVGHLYAATSEIHIPGGLSATVARELVFVPVPDTPAQKNALSVIIRDTRTHAAIATQTLLPFAPPDGTDHYIRALWSPKSSFVAFNVRWTRHTRQTLIYRVAESQLTLIRLPDYWFQAQRALGRRADFVGGTETPVQWLDEHTLLLRSFGTLRDETRFDLLVTITVSGSTASIRSVTLPNET